MGVVTASSSAARTPFGLGTKFSTYRSTVHKRPLVVAFKEDKPNNTALFVPQDRLPLPIETPKGKKKKRGKSNNEASSSALELDYNEAAAKLESIYKLSPPATDVDVDTLTKKPPQKKKNRKKDESKPIVRNHAKSKKRLSLDKRVALKINKEEGLVNRSSARKDSKNENEKIDKLVREYSASTDLASLDWKKTKIPPVLPSAEHAWLFKLMQPMKVSV